MSGAPPQYHLVRLGHLKLRACHYRCGLAGGTWFAQTLGGDFNATKYAKLGDKGSVVLPYRPTGVVWKRGETVHPTWFVRANHGGGKWLFHMRNHSVVLDFITACCAQGTRTGFANTRQAST